MLSSARHFSLGKRHFLLGFRHFSLGWCVCNSLCHNGLLEMLLQAGIPGLVMYLFLMGRMLLAAARQFFNQKLPSWQRMLAAAPVIMLINILMEIYPCVSGNVMDMMYMVLAGAVIALDQKKTTMPDQA